MPGQRYTSNRRRAPGQGRAGGQAVGLTGAKRARRVSESPGPLAYSGNDAVTCPGCGVGLDPNRSRAGTGPIPKHARFGYTTLATGRPPCRGYVEALEHEEVKTMAETKELTKAQVASKAQARAHKELRDAHPEEYQDAYKRAKEELAH